MGGTYRHHRHDGCTVEVIRCYSQSRIFFYQQLLVSRRNLRTSSSKESQSNGVACDLSPNWQELKSFSKLRAVARRPFLHFFEAKGVVVL